MTEFRSKMFQIMPRLRPNEEIVVSHNGRDAYIVKRAAVDRNGEFARALAACPKLTLTDEEIIAFKNEGRK
jgi:hypothetical protein